MPEPTTLSARLRAERRADDGLLRDYDILLEAADALEACGAQSPRGTCLSCRHFSRRGAYVTECALGVQISTVVMHKGNRRESVMGPAENFSCSLYASLYAPAAVVDEVTR